jgi:hypothetical protein
MPPAAYGGIRTGFSSSVGVSSRPRFGGLLAASGDTVQTGPDATARLPDTATEVWWLAGLLAPDALPEGWPPDFASGGLRIRTGATATKDDVVRLTTGDAEALREAQLAMLAGPPAHPFHWAPFSLW